MNEIQKKFFEQLAIIQKDCIDNCMINHQCQDDRIENMLYECSYDVITKIMEMIDGYSDFSKDKHDIINTVTGECIKEKPFIELHDLTEEFLKYKL